MPGQKASTVSPENMGLSFTTTALALRRIEICGCWLYSQCRKNQVKSALSVRSGPACMVISLNKWKLKPIF